MSNNFTDIKTGLNHIGKSIIGYSIYRSNSNNKFIISSYKSNRIKKKHLMDFSNQKSKFKCKVSVLRRSMSTFLKNIYIYI